MDSGFRRNDVGKFLHLMISIRYKNFGLQSKIKKQPKKVARGAKKVKKQEELCCCWNIDVLDIGGRWGWNNIDPKLWWNHLCPARQDFSTMKWAEIVGDRHHSIPVEAIVKEARERLDEIGQGDIDMLFSFSLGSTRRIWGIKDRQLWHPSFAGLHFFRKIVYYRTENRMSKLEI